MWMRPNDAAGQGMGLIRWRDLARTFGPAVAAEFLRGARAGEVATMTPGAAAAGPAGADIELTVRAAGEWHVDVSAGGGRFRTARAASPTESRLHLDGVGPGSVLVLSLNRVRATHLVAGDNLSVRCEPSETRTVLLRAPFEGDLVFAGGFTLHYRATFAGDGEGARIAGAQP